MTIKNPYRAAGTFQGESYVPREADAKLLREVTENQRYPYCLAPRQSGKSSLLVHLMRKLDQALFHVCLIDLSIFTLEQLKDYDKFLQAFAKKALVSLNESRSIDLLQELDQLIQVIIRATDKRIVIFIDEIDTLLLTSFKDVFFAQVRAIFNGRSRQSRFEQVQFVLAGVAQPSQLISSKYMSPFNIGISIKLMPITKAQTYELGRFLTYPNDQVRHAVCDEINHHTNGSVYLTQLVFEGLWKLSHQFGVRTVGLDDVEAVISDVIRDAKHNIHFMNIYEVLLNDQIALREFRSFRSGKTIDRRFLEFLEMVGITDGQRPFRNKIYQLVFDYEGPLSLFDTYERLWQERSDLYYSKIRKIYGSLQVFGMPRPVPLESVFTTAYVLDKPSALSRFSIKALQRAHADPSKPPKTQRIGSRALLKGKTNLFILGKPGAGKTTLLKHLAVQAATKKIEGVPIFVSLKEWADSELDLIDFIVNQFSICDFPNQKAVVDYILNEERALVLFDGLDEVNQARGKRERQIREMRSFMETYVRPQYFITCRIAAVDYSFEPFSYVEIADFTQKQIHTFVTNWFRKGEGVGDEYASKRFLQEFARYDNRGLRDLAGTPLLLTLLCLAFNETLAFPLRRVEVYEEALDALLKKWDASRSIRRDEVYRQLSVGHKKNLLSNIAAATFEKGKYFISETELKQLVMQYVKRLPSFQSSEVFDAEMILRSLEAQHGIITERARGIYSFAHVSFQEYLTAKYIVSNNARRSLKALLSNQHINDLRWREVIMCTASLLDDADEFFCEFQKSLNDLVSSSKSVLDVLGWAAIQPSAGGIGDPLYFRASNIYQLTRSLKYPRLKELQHSVNALTRSLRASPQSSSETATQHISQRRDSAVNHSWDMSPKEEQDFAAYIKGSLLLLDCLNVATVSDRESIRAKVLDPTITN